MENLSIEEFEQFQKELATIGIYEAVLALIEKKHASSESNFPFSKNDEIEMLSLFIYKKVKIHIKKIRIPLKDNTIRNLDFRGIISTWLGNSQSSIFNLSTFFEGTIILGSKIICVLMDWAKDSEYKEKINSIKISYTGISENTQMKELFLQSIKNNNIQGFDFYSIVSGVKHEGIQYLFSE